MEVIGQKQKRKLSHHHYLLISIASAILFVGIVVLIVGGKTPEPRLTSLVNSRQPLDAAVTIAFDWPVSRDVSISVSPQVFGTVDYGDAMTHDQLVRSLTFTPEITWLPDTTYEVTVGNVSSAIPSFSQSGEYHLTFTTPSTPTVTSVSPGQTDPIRADTSWTITASQPVTDFSVFDFSLTPQHEFTTVLSDDQMQYTLTPTGKLSQGDEYTLAITRRDIRYLFGTTDVATQTDPEEMATNTYTVREAPGVTSFVPSGDRVGLTDPIVMTMNDNVDFDQFEEYVTIDPAVEGDWTTDDYLTLTFTPDRYAMDTQYRVTIAENLPTFEGGFLPEASIHTFSTLGPVSMTDTTPAAGAAGVSVNSAVRIAFDQLVEHASAESSFSISPVVAGSISWEGNTLIFTPTDPFDFNTSYTVTLASGIQSTNGFDSTDDQTLSFSTELSVTKLDITYDRQDHSLSCEVAVLKMGLSYYGVSVDEQPLIDAIGVDPTAKSGGVWGDPNVAFVGDIDGRQPSTGYGVYWDPIAAAGAAYRTTRAFTGGEIGHILGEILQGHPVEIWGTAGSGSDIDWQTPEGTHIDAINGEHTFLVIGFVGSASNPTKIIVLDPLSGERYLSLDYFLWMWGLLGNSGVVIE